MELKYVILVLTSLCVVFIVVEELYQSRSFSSHWNSPKSRITLSKDGDDDNDEVASKSSPSQKEEKGQRKKGGWVEEDDIDHDSKDEEVQKEEDNVWSRKRWKEWTAKVRPKSTHDSVVKVGKGKKGRKKQNPNRKLYHKLWTDETDDMDEEEKLRKSPYIYHAEEEMKRMRRPVIQSGFKYFSFFLPWEKKDNNRHTFDNCRYKKCAFVNDMTQADLVAFKAGNIRDHDIHSFQRPPGQSWLMYTIDPAIRGYDLSRADVQNMFNATMTYNLDADIPQIFGRLQRVADNSPQAYYDTVFDGKTKMVAWFVSHCSTPSKREDYVAQMQTVIDVDVFGECGNLTCGNSPRGPTSRSDDATVCLPLLTNTYKFYLAFENAFCLDYITEKFFKLFKDVQIVPVVRGGFQYKKYLPSGMFVDADDFKSPEELSRYLIDLGNDKQRYTEMLRRKNEWKLVKSRDRHCLLCEYLHTSHPNKFYPNLNEKFSRQSCWYPKSL